MTSSPAQTRARHLERPVWVLLASIVAVALIMRGPFIGMAPLASVFRTDVGFSAAEFGILTGIPILCFAFFSPLASWIGQRIGPEMAISATAVFVGVGTVVRSLGPVPAVYIGTAVIGMAITIGNIMMPLIIRRDFPPARQSLAMGIYSGTLNLGAFLASMVIVPLDQALGWQWALGLAALAALAALLLWVYTFGPARALRPHRVTSGGTATGATSLGGTTAENDAAVQGMDAQNQSADARSGRATLAEVQTSARLRGPVLAVTVLLTLAFVGQSSSYYGLTVWLPSYLHEAIGLDTAAAGAGSSIFQVFGIAGALTTPLLVKLLKPSATTVIIGLLWVSVPLGLLFVPSQWWLWAMTSGFAQGGGFTLILLASIKAAGNNAQATRISAIVQGVGYLFAGIAPTILGGVHEATDSWQVALLVPLVTTLMFLLCTSFGVRWALSLEAERHAAERVARS